MKMIMNHPAWTAYDRIFHLFVLMIAVNSNAICSVHENESVAAAGFRWASNRTGQATTPPRGWNSYDSFSWLVTEQQFLDNAQYVASNLLQHGYEYVVVDFLWYRKNEPGASVYGGTDVIDDYGRLQPDPERWPSSAGGIGFSRVAEKVHSLGLKFGIHVMKGVSLAAVNKNSTILGTQGETVQSIARLNNCCSWMPNSFVAVNTTIPAGRAFILSLYQQYASWGVDFIKHDCVFGIDLDRDEVSVVSETITRLGIRPMYYSLSPGVGTTVELAREMGKYVNAYRVTGDTWDVWTQIRDHFDIARQFVEAGLLGSAGLEGNSWPDLDMLPLGWLTDPGVNQVAYRECRLTKIEQTSLMTLWALAKSPLFYGGDLRKMDETTLSLITNSLMLEINANSKDNREVDLQSLTPEKELSANTDENTGDLRVWAATGQSGEVYLAVFNLGETISSVRISLARLLQALRKENATKLSLCSGEEIWTKTSLQLNDGVLLTSVVNHGSFLYSFNCS